MARGALRQAEAARTMGSEAYPVIESAPGSYVLEK
jgi:poly(3-hydroxyalkanoate) synthetase